MTLQVKIGMRVCKRNSSAGTKVSEEAGGGGVQGDRAEIPLEPAVKIMVRQEVGVGAEIHLQPLEDPTPKQVDA